ncbi:MAG: hypothetical protein LBG99_08700 [Propionibacteriaceae bacterium]|jgi:hypothetical protein|nr:hypothetical protein [Propionibacteriaceae bacterium]
MNDMDITVILDDLASGRIDAAEAKLRIDALSMTVDENEVDTEMSTEWPLPPLEEPPGAPQDPAPDEVPPKAEKINGVSKVVIKATGRKVKVIADPLVSRASAEDVHQVKRRGSTLIIVGDKEFSGVVDAISWAKSVRGLDDVKALGIGKELTVRVNPALEVDVDLTGSSLMMADIPHIGKVRLTAGVATISGASMISDMVIQAGTANVSGKFTEGWSRVRCESGQVVVDVSSDSDVRVRADAQLGRVTWEGCEPEDGDLILGEGTAHLDVGVVIGHAAVKVV